MPAPLDFQQILANPTATYDEGLRFFRGEGLINQTLKQLAADLDARGIDYAVIGAVALNQHGYQRFTSDIVILLSPAGLERFRAELVGRGYCPVEGAKKKFRATSENVPIEIITAGEYPGDGKPKSIVVSRSGAGFGRNRRRENGESGEVSRTQIGVGFERIKPFARFGRRAGFDSDFGFKRQIRREN